MNNLSCSHLIQKSKKSFRLQFISVFLTLFCCLLNPATAKSNVVKVGIYDNPPIVFMNEQGEPAGLAIDLLERLAKTENWTLKYTPDTLQEVNNKLRRGEIDLLVGVDFIAARATQYYFTHEYEVVDTSIVFNPVEIRYASPRRVGSQYVLKLDYLLSTEKPDPNSLYHQSIKKWLASPHQSAFPYWLVWIFALALLAAIIVLIINTDLRRLIAKKQMNSLKSNGALNN